MTVGRIARRLAALALIMGVVWLYGVRASATFSDFNDDGTATAVIKGPPEGDYSGKTVILHSNDTVGAVEGFPRMAWLKHEFERLGAETILADAGNFSAGSIYASGEGGAAMELMNLTGYDVAALGRYDWNYGYDAMRRNLRRAAFPILCANATEGGEAICTPNYSYTTSSGVTVGFFGLLPPRAAHNMDYAQGHEVKIDQREDIGRRVQEQIDTLRRAGNVIPGADVVIALSSLGNTDEPSDAGCGSFDIFSNTKGLDMILDCYVVMSEGPNGERVQSCGDSFAYVGAVIIDDKTKAIEDHYLIATEGLEDDPDVLKAAENLQNRYKMEVGAIFARTETNLNGEKAPGNRTEETNFGDLISDAIVWTARQELKNPLVNEDHMIGLTNGAGIRASIPPGNITRNHVFAVFPYANTVSVVYVTGQELLEALEACTWCLPEEYSNSYPQSSGHWRSESLMTPENYVQIRAFSVRRLSGECALTACKEGRLTRRRFTLSLPITTAQAVAARIISSERRKNAMNPRLPLKNLLQLISSRDLGAW